MTKKLALGVYLLVLGQTGFAGVYSFGGGCASMGSWTQSALSQTDALIKITQSLRDVPECKGIESIVPKLQVAEELLKTPEGDSKRQDRLESLPNEMSALRNFVVGSPDLKEQVMKLLASRTLEGATLATEATTAGSLATAGAAVAGPEALAIAEGLKAIGSRLKKTSRMGLDMLDQILAIMPSYQECLMGHPDQGLAMIGATVKLTAAFASSQDDIASRMGNTISNLVTFLRNMKFSKVLRQLNETEFWMSMSCLMETTSQTYCSTRDARTLLDYGIKELKPAISNNGRIDIENPLAGYYVLTRDIPVVASWLQKIQFGITPKLSTDATFKNRVWEDVSGLMQLINTIHGSYNEALLTYSTLPDANSKRNALLQLIRALESRIAGNEGGGRGGMNFFTMSVMPDLVPFRLIGRSTIPVEVSVGTETKAPISWEAYMLNSGKFLPEFQDPDALARIIESELEKLIDSALEKASLYFQQRMIVDMSNLVNESVTSQAHTVVESLERIRDYLNGLEKRIRTNKGDIILVPSIRNTVSRIAKVLKAYDEIRETVMNLPPAGSDDTAEARYDEEVNKGYKKVIEMAYEQFQILLQRDTFLSTRIGTFIHHDYAMRVRNNESMSQYEKSLLLESGNSLLSRLLGTFGSNPTAALNDLTTAQVVNKRNLNALEHLFKDSLYPTIEEIKLITENRATNTRLTLHSLSRMYKDAYFNKVNEEDGWFHKSLGYAWAFTKSVGTAGTLPWIRRYYHSDLYPFHVSLNPITRGADDEMGSFDQFRARLCIQTLAFNDRKFFKKVCSGTVLKSAFQQTGASARNAIQLDAAYDRYIQGDKLQNPVTSDSICAFQTYARRNQVYWMTLDIDNQQ